MNAKRLPLLLSILFALPLDAQAGDGKCYDSKTNQEVECASRKPKKTEPPQFIQKLTDEERQQLNQTQPVVTPSSPDVANEQGAFRRPGGVLKNGGHEGHGGGGSFKRGAMDSFVAPTAENKDTDGDPNKEPVGDPNADLPDMEIQAGDPPEVLIATLEAQKAKALSECDRFPNNERCKRRAEQFFGKVIGNIRDNPDGNAAVRAKDLEIGYSLWKADIHADRLKWRSEKDPSFKDEYMKAVAMRDKLMEQLHEHAGASAFHVVIMDEVNTEPQPGGRGSFEDWVRRNRKFPPAHIGLGQQWLKENDPAKAVESFSEAIALDPRSAAAYSGRAAAHFKMGDIRQAYDDAVAALRLDPNDKSAFATLKLTEGRVGAAGGVAGAAQGAGGTNDAGQSSGGGPSFGAYDPAASAAMLSNTTPAAIEANRLNALARRAMQLGDKRAALDAAQKSLNAYGQNPFAYGVMARYAFGDREYKAALAAAEAGLKLSPKDRALLSMKARSANRLRDAVAAAAAAEALLGMDARDAEGLANLAHARGLAGDRAGMDALLAQAARANGHYQVSVESALQMPEGSDMLFLFPGEESTEMLAALKAAKDAKGAPKRFGVVAIASLIGGLLIGLGLLSSMAGPLTQRVKSAFTRMTSSHPVMRQEDRAVIAPALEIPGVAEAGLLRGQYRVKKQIGAGGMGLVFEGEDITLGRRVAIKKMRDELRLDRRERQRFVNEAKMVAALHHANIVDIYAIVEDNEDVYLVFEYVKGSTVHDLIGVKGALSWREALGIFRSMTAALEFAHGRNIIHRDLKPSNVMVDDEGYVKVMDFGIARAAKDAANKVSMTNTVVGTPPYMAPEQEQGVVRKESDVYALAICLYEMLTGKMPFVGVAGGMLMNKINMNFVKPSAMVSGLPAGIDEVFARAFQADPDKRFATAREMLSALNDLAPSTRPDTSPTSLRNLPGENS